MAEITFGRTRRLDSWQGALSQTPILRGGVEIGTIVGRRALGRGRWLYELEFRSPESYKTLAAAKEAAAATAPKGRRKR